MLEAGAGGGDRERPAFVQQPATKQGGLAESCTYLPTFSNAVGPHSYVLGSPTQTVLCTIENVLNYKKYIL